MISIIIPAFNAEKQMARCLDGLRAQQNGRNECEIIVVDDGSTDATREIAQEHGARVLQQTNRGAAAARNLGAQNARGDIVLFLDGDCEPDPNWVASMLAPFAEPIVVGAGGMKQTRQSGLLPRFIQAEFDYRYDQVRSHRYIDFIDSGTAAYRRDIFLKNHGFDTTLMDAEDVELSFRLAEQGHKMAFAPEAIVYHDHPRSVWEYARRKFMYAYWRAFVYKRFPKKIASDSRTPQTQKIQSALALMVLPAFLAAMFWDKFSIVAVLLALMLFATTLPLVIRFLSRDWQVALAAVFLIPLAAFAVGAGVALGAISPQRARRANGRAQ
jgi:cellulose synthase/poly-beta-1,6-N-acetylglucosamine synthase-like glycosyltransferase